MEQVYFIGFSEFAASLEAASEAIGETFQAVCNDVALQIRTTAQVLVPKRTYALMSHIIAEPFAEGAMVSVQELYGAFVEYGTGLYGPKHQVITPKTAKVMAWKGSDGNMVFAASTKGMHAKPYFNPAVDKGMIELASESDAAMDTIMEILS